MPSISTKRKFNEEELRQIHKSKAVCALFKPEIYAAALPMFKEFGMRGRSEFFDHIIVGGIAYLNHDICQLVIDKSKKVREDFSANAGARFREGGDKGRKKTKQIIFWLYPRDFDSLNRWAIQKNIYKQWIYNILLEEFVARNPIVLKFVEYCKTLDINKKKTRLAHVSQDSYILALPVQESKVLLDRFTENYDNKKFDNELIKEIIELKEKQEKTKKEEEDLEEGLQQKIATLREKRRQTQEKISQPVLDDEGDLIDEPGAYPPEKKVKQPRNSP